MQQTVLVLGASGRFADMQPMHFNLRAGPCAGSTDGTTTLERPVRAWM